MSHYYNDSIFWIDVEKIKPNPYQPRKDFDQAHLESLADSIKQYGVLQALVVTRKEVEKPDGGLDVEYELIAGERRLRASKLAGLQQVPVLIKTGSETDLMKLELAIIENVQREDLNPIDRARAFEKLATEFKLKHADIARKVGKSREYVSNTIRILSLPPIILEALSKGQISEGHTRPILMLGDRPDEQTTLFKEIVFKKLTVREAEAISRKIAYDKVRKREYVFDPELADLEEKISASLGTRVSIERKEDGGKLTIDFFSNDDLHIILDLIKNNQKRGQGSPTEMLDRHIAAKTGSGTGAAAGASMSTATTTPAASPTATIETAAENIVSNQPEVPKEFTDDRAPAEKVKDDNEEIYSVANFSL
jgi:ParB family chromosome partitioning protein